MGVITPLLHEGVLVRLRVSKVHGIGVFAQQLIKTGSNIGACAETVCSGNTFPQLYDPLGRYVFAGATVNF